MKKIKLVKSNGVKFNAIDVPVNICGKEMHLIVPFLYAPKRLSNGLCDVCISYSNGISDRNEELIINYYEDLVMRAALIKIYFVTVSRTELRAIFDKHNKYFDGVFENNFCQSVGLGVRYWRSPAVEELIDNLLKQFTYSEKEKWCFKYVEDYFTAKELIKQYDGQVSSFNDIQLLESLSDDEREEMMSDCLADEKWYKIFVKDIFLPYVKERIEQNKKRIEEIEQAKQLINEFEEKLSEAKKRLSELLP